jgi:hypothetical protein
MRSLIALLFLVLGLTACESGKSGAEISALGESLVSSANSGAYVPTSLAIDINPRTALNYANAVNACVAESRTLCSIDQYNAGMQKGLVAYSFGHPGNYWMVPTNAAPGAGGSMRNEFQVTTTIGVTYLQVATTSPLAFYCCL